ncbi:MarR family winged helix-turn-helix transcriptional regulator [uncultured Alsobacter sp.]|uniref:MarR family winged helix-turn-helix transcriptional regulator n=1 Tax=uncultured Alsobacter sp. TaxID=1748258 RepID=UPI0025F696AB|nr:MarR family transcriptional regulator [uncultured Alsobacter sp.]
MPPVPGRPEDFDGHGIDVVTQARLWENPSWFAFRFNYLSLRYNIPLYGSIEQRYGLVRPQVAVIYSLGLRDQVTARDIGISYGFPKNTLSRAIVSLEKRGLITRQRHPTDKRSWLLSLTPEGRKLFVDTLPRFVHVQDEMLKPLTPKERETLSVLLAKIVLATFSWPAEGVPGLPPFPDDANSEPAAHDASAA